MSEIATVAGGGGRRDRGPLIEVPAEVINKKKKAAISQFHRLIAASLLFTLFYR